LLSKKIEKRDNLKYDFEIISPVTNISVFTYKYVSSR